MTEEFEDDEIEQAKGLPGWMATFADMMALLMCFFVLLLSYSEMDAQKFKRIAGAMKNAFGVQNQINLDGPPKGVSVIAQEFSPDSLDPSPINIIEQSTVDSSNQFVERSVRERIIAEAIASARQQHEQELEEAGKRYLQELQYALKEEVQSGVLELEQNGQQIIFRIRERGSFSSASAFLQPRFKPVILKITKLLNDIPGEVAVSGHTDSQPIAPDMFDNNWDLSAQRAVAVATQMTRVADFDVGRMTVSGHASNEPKNKANTLAAHQANRRVEIIVTHGKATDKGVLELLQQE